MGGTRRLRQVVIAVATVCFGLVTITGFAAPDFTADVQMACPGAMAFGFALAMAWLVSAALALQ